MIIVLNISSEKFSLNGIPYFKNFMPHVLAGKLKIVNVYDTVFSLCELENYTNYIVNGVAFGDVISLQNALLPVLYTRNSLNFYSDLPFYNQITKENGFSSDGLTKTFNAGWEWIINNVQYSNLVPIDIIFPLTDPGKKRIDRVVATNDNTFVRISGSESYSSPTASARPDNTVDVTFILVTDSTVGTPTDPDNGISNGPYVTKAEAYIKSVTNSGIVNNYELSTGHTCLSFDNAVTEFKSMNVNTPVNWLYHGRPLFMYNNQAIDLLIKHAVTGLGDFTFEFPNDEDFLLAPGNIIQFKLFLTSTTIGIYRYVGVNSSNPETTTSILSKIGDGTTISQVYLPSYVDDVLEFANLAAFPATGETGKIYIAVSPSTKQYRWSGSTYVQITNGLIASTADVPENASFLYFTTARVLATVLTGISFATGGAIVSTDTVLVAFGKLQKQITDLPTTSATISGVKTFLSGTLGLRNGANTFTSFITNTNTASRTYTLQDRNGTIADLTDIAGVAAAINEQTNFQTEFAYTVGLTDVNTKISFNSPAGNTPVVVTIPNNSTTAFQIGSKFRVVRTVGGGNTNIVGAAGVTISGAGTLFGNNVIALVTKTGTNSWVIEFSSPFTINGSNMTALFALTANLIGSYQHNTSIVLKEPSGNTKMSMNSSNNSGFYSFNHIVKYDSDLSASYDARTFIDKGYFDNNRFDLSSLGLYANDSAASSAGVLIGYAYINSVTGALQRRLT